MLGVAATAAALTACGSAKPVRKADGTTTTPTLSVPPTSTPPPSTTDPTATATTGPAAFVSTGPTDRNQVALTFHTNGDLTLIQQALDLLDARRVPMTAFVVGSWLRQNPDWAKRLVAGGHELANHTQTHPGFSKLPPAQMNREIVECRDVLRATSGSGGAFFRPSGTADGTTSPSPVVLAAAGDAGYRTVLGFDVDPLDYQDPGAAAIAARTIKAVHPGAIVSLHLGRPGTIPALPAILDDLRQRGLKPVTASDLLA